MAKRKKTEEDPTLKAWGQLVAEIPEVEEVLDFYRALPPDLPEEERREQTVERIHRFFVEADASELGDHVLSSELLDVPIWPEARQLLDQAEAHFGALTLRTVLRWLASFSGLDEVAYSWVRRTVQSGEAAPYPELFHGGLFTVPLPGGALDGGSLPLVVAVVSPSARIEDVMVKLRAHCADAFQDCYNPEPGTIAELARIMAYRKQNKTIGQIAWLLLAERSPEIRALPDDQERKRQYPDDYRKEMNRLRQLIHRLPK